MSDDGKTRIIRRSDASSSGAPEGGLPIRQAEHTVKVGSPRIPAPAQGGGALPSMGVTRKVNVQPQQLADFSAGGDSDSDSRTRLFRPGAKDAAPEPQPEAEWDPVVGWVVVVRGPGKGKSVPLGMGHNGIGRGPDQRVCLDFGDSTISRDSHGVITFDPKSGRFYVMNGGQGRNLLYVNKAPVLQAAELKTGDDIELGGTTLRFAAFCSEVFKWDEE